MTSANSVRKGWCPGALRPMLAKDGLLVRIKPSCGVLRAAQAQELADSSRRYGNGLLDLTSRGNLQIRGVRHDQLAALQARLDGLGLLDPNPEAEAIRNILISPMHGIEGKLNIAFLAKALEGELTKNQALHALPPKFSFLIDDGSLPSLQDITGDVRFHFLRQPDIFGIGIGGTGATGYSLGECKAAELVETAAQIAQRFLSLMSQHGVTKMRELISLLDSNVVTAFGFSDSSFKFPVQKTAMVPIGMLRIKDRNVLGLGLPFGRCTSSMLNEVAYSSTTLGEGEIRLTPFRSFLIPGVKTSVSTACLTGLIRKGFIVEPQDPRLKIAACGGLGACEQATTLTQEDGLALAELVAPNTNSKIQIHVSGCKKGCAHAAPAPFTLVGNAGLYDIIGNGIACGIPLAQSLNLTEVKSFLKKQFEGEVLHDR